MSFDIITKISFWCFPLDSISDVSRTVKLDNVKDDPLSQEYVLARVMTNMTTS